MILSGTVQMFDYKYNWPFEPMYPMPFPSASTKLQLYKRNHFINISIFNGGDLAPSLGGRKNFSRTKISEWRSFWKKISIFTPKNSDDFFLVIDQVFQILTLFFQISRFFTV